MSGRVINLNLIVISQSAWSPSQAYPSAGFPPNNISYSDTVSAVQALSTNNELPESSGNGIIGLLYVPGLDHSDPCINDTAPYLPRNVTRITDLPASQYPTIALAPWVSVNCTRSYLAAMHSEGVDASIFFHPDNQTAIPPPVSDPSWTLDDGGQWKGQNSYPVYAVSGAVGSQWMEQLSVYSGSNITHVPHGDQLARIFGAASVPRLVTQVTIPSHGPRIPSLWIFIIIVICCMFVFVVSTSFVMHLVQRRHRAVLQRRVANGEVDLESLGIKRLNVPQDALDKMPRYLYTDREVHTNVPREPPSEKEASAATRPSPSPRTNTSTTLPTREVPLSQSTCAICLDDFEHKKDMVRELPCSHIFHPDCIDPFLRENSSLCPMCKKSAVQPGYLPVNVTNAMVRRERLMRQMRSNRAALSRLESSQRSNVSRPDTLASRMPSFHRQFGRHGAARTPTASSYPATELRPLATQPETVPPEIARADPETRRAWGRRRVVEALQQEPTTEEAEIEAEQRRPAWCRAAGRVFPGLR